MDRNLGASQVANSSSDSYAYGDLYQWGRGADSHQCRNSATTSLWQSVNGANNPCPIGYRLPTETELDTERLSWTTNNTVGAFDTPLKLTLSGRRLGSNGSLNNVGSSGHYWSSTVNISDTHFLYFGSSNAEIFTSSRSLGFAVRCIKN